MHTARLQITDTTTQEPAGFTYLTPARSSPAVQREQNVTVEESISFDDYFRTLVRPAVAAMVTHPEMFSKRAGRGGRTESFILDLSQPLDMTVTDWDSAALRTAVQAELEAHPDFLTHAAEPLSVDEQDGRDPFACLNSQTAMSPRKRNKRRGVVWVCDPPRSFGNDPDRQDAILLRYLDDLEARFPGWICYAVATSRNCVVSRRVHRAVAKGYGHQRVRHPDGPSTACPASAQNTGACRYRVMPSFLLWENPRRKKPKRPPQRPPHTADLIVIESWPRSDETWVEGRLLLVQTATGDMGVKHIRQLSEVADDPLYAAVAPLLRALAGLTQHNREMSGTDLYQRLSAAIYGSGADIPAMLRTWQMEASQRDDQRGQRPVKAWPRNIERLIAAVAADHTAWLRGEMDDASRVRVLLNEVRVQKREQAIPPLLGRKAVIDLSGEARTHRKALAAMGVTVLSPEEVIARVGPMRQSKREEQVGDAERLEQVMRRWPTRERITARAVADRTGIKEHKLHAGQGPLADRFAALKEELGGSR